MKRNLLFVFMIFILCFKITAQYDWDMQQKKYWFYRSRLDYFVVPGPNDGESQIVDIRNINGTSKIAFGQHSVYFGYYLGVLATEYYLLDYYQQDINNTRNELELAMNAYINYMDKCEWEYYGVPDAYDGFYVRNSVKCDFLKPNTQLGEQHRQELNKDLTIDDNWATMYPHCGKPGYIVDLEKNCCGMNNGSFNYDGIPCGEPLSQDEAIGILKGLALVFRCLPATDQLKWTAADIAIRIITYIAFNQPWPEEWWIHDPLNQYIGDNNGGNAIVYSYPFSRTAGYFGFPPATFWGSPSGVNTIWRTSWQSMQYWGYGAMNNSMTVNLAAICNCWDGTLTGLPFINTTAEGIQNISNQDYWNGFYSMLYELLQNNRTNQFGETVRAMVKDQINNAPSCGPYCFESGVDMAPWGWAGSYKFEQGAHIQQNGKPDFAGCYNGLDYMLLYNLFHIIELWDDYDNVRDAEQMSYYYNQNDFVPWINNVPFCFSPGPVIGNNSLPINYHGYNTIESTQNIDIFIHDALLPDGTVLQCNSEGNYDPGNVTYRAGISIRLLPGFHAKAGSYFHAYIEPFDCMEGFNKNFIDTENANDEYWNSLYQSKNIATYTGFEAGTFSKVDSLQKDLNTSCLVAYPNPFVSSVNIALDIPAGSNIRLYITDLFGKIVKVVYEGTSMTAKPQFNVLSDDLNPGVYICVLEFNDIIEQLKLIRVQ